MKLPEGKSRLDLVREGLNFSGLAKRGRLVVSIDRLREDPRNERRLFRNMEGLIESVREHGILEPITVTPDGDFYMILTGHRRFRAAKAAGRREVEVLIREPESEAKRRIKSLISNVQRENLGVLELAEALQSILSEDPDITTQAELGRRVGKSEQWVSEMLNVLTLPASLQLRLRTSEVPVPYDSVMKIAHVNDAEEQEALIDDVLKGESVRSIREKVRAAHRDRPTKSYGRPMAKRTERIQENLNGYTAIVSGPATPDSAEHMRAVVLALLERLRPGQN